jgi:hypothetical protein
MHPDADQDLDQTVATGLSAVLIALFLIAATLLSLVTLDHLKYLFVGEKMRPSMVTVFGAMTVLDWILLSVATATSVALITVPAVKRGYLALWQGQSWLLLAPVAAALLFSGHAILGRGLIVTGDAGTHVARVHHLAMALLQGDTPFWDNYFFGGSTLLQFTGPVFHWLAALVELIVGDPTRAIKYVAFTARAAAALFMYLLLRRLGTRRTTAALGALFYAGAFFMTYMEIIRSSFPQLINFAAMPAVFYFLEEILRRPAILGRGTLGLSFSAIGFIGSHQPTALIFSLLVGFYLTARLYMTGSYRPTLRALAAAVIITGLGSVFFLLPFALERSMTADNFAAASLISFAWPSAQTLRNLFVWGAAGTGPEYSAYAGLPMLACAAAGAFTMRNSPRPSGRDLRPIWGLLIGLVLISLFVRGAYVRQATFSFFLLCVAAGVGLEMLARMVPAKLPLHAAIFLLMLLDAGPLAVQPWTRTDLVPLAAAGNYLAYAAKDARIIEVQQVDGKAYISDDPSLNPPAYARLQILAGPHKQDATRAHNGFAALLKIAQQDLQATRWLEPATRAMLAIANVGWIVGDDLHAMGLPADYKDTETTPILGAYWRIPEATPFIVSQRLEVMARPASFDAAPFWDISFDRALPDATAAMAAMRAINQRMQPDPSTRSADAILVPVRPQGPDWSDNAPGRPAATVRMLSYSVDPGTVRLSVQSDSRGFIRLAHPLGLGVQATQDGSVVMPAADVQSLIVLPLHAGRNDFVISAIASPLRQICFWTTVSVLTALALLTIIRG